MAEENKTKVRRIKADDSEKSKAKTDKNIKKTQKTVKKAEKGHRVNTPKWLLIIGKPFFAIGRYVRNSWRELRITKWPNRRATWSLTLAVIIFAIFFATLIVLVDYGFEWLMQEVIL